MSYEVEASLVETGQISRSFSEMRRTGNSVCMRLKMSKCCASRVEKEIVARAERKQQKRAAVNSSQAFCAEEEGGELKKKLGGGGVLVAAK